MRHVICICCNDPFIRNSYFLFIEEYYKFTIKYFLIVNTENILGLSESIVDRFGRLSNFKLLRGDIFENMVYREKNSDKMLCRILDS